MIKTKIYKNLTKIFEIKKVFSSYCNRFDFQKPFIYCTTFCLSVFYGEGFQTRLSYRMGGSGY